MKQLTGILDDLREKRLWPVALALVAALVAVPLLLSKSPHAVPVAQSPFGGLPVSGSVPSVSVSDAPAQSRLTSHGHDPFAQPKGASSAATATNAVAGAANSAVGAANSAGSTLSQASTGSTAGGGAGAPTGTPVSSSGTSAPAATIPVGKPKPAPTGLTPTQSYHVTFSITNATGGVNTIDPLERLSVLPSSQQPLLVELGVLRGASRAVFAVQPGTVVSGPGKCIPGPVDCEILEVAQDQVENLAMHSQSGLVPVAMFAVTGISADNHGSVAAADAARRRASAAGRRLLDSSPLGALPLFAYDPSVGAVLDLRNLTVGGS